MECGRVGLGVRAAQWVMTIYTLWMSSGKSVSVHWVKAMCRWRAGALARCKHRVRRVRRRRVYVGRKPRFRLGAAFPAWRLRVAGVTTTLASAMYIVLAQSSYLQAIGCSSPYSKRETLPRASSNFPPGLILPNTQNRTVRALVFSPTACSNSLIRWVSPLPRRKLDPSPARCPT
jgi:hypothetical protein